MRFLICIIFVALCYCTLCLGGCLANDAVQKKEFLDKDRELIESLIEQLRSPNKDPNPHLSPVIGYPSDYDFAAQKRVDNASRKLVALSTYAFPILIEHANDKAYCRSFPEAVLAGHSVGFECFQIIKKQIDLASIHYKSRLGSDGLQHMNKGYFSQFSAHDECYTQDGLKCWWRKHKHQSLKEMQIEAVNWAIGRERAIGFPDAKDQERYLRPLEEKLTEITK